MNNSDKLRLGFVSDGKLLVKFAFVYGQTSEVIVGRSANAQICINHNVISSQHAQLIYDANGNLVSQEDDFGNKEEYTYETYNYPCQKLSCENSVGCNINPEECSEFSSYDGSPFLSQDYHF
jgi:hypothetical protein